MSLHNDQQTLCQTYSFEFSFSVLVAAFQYLTGSLFLGPPGGSLLQVMFRVNIGNLFILEKRFGLPLIGTINSQRDCEVLGIRERLTFFMWLAGYSSGLSFKMWGKHP